MSKPNVIQTLVVLVSGELFKRPRPDPGVVVVFDHRDRRGPNRHLSEEAKAAGVTCPEGDGHGSRRLF